MDATPRGKGPGIVAWSLVMLSLVLPIVGGWLGVRSGGAEPSTVRLYASVGVLTLATLVGLVVHLWGIVRAFYPAYNGGWLAVAVFGVVSGVATLAAAGSVLVYVFKD